MGKSKANLTKKVVHKAKPKYETKTFHIDLNNEQIEAKRKILNNTITFLIGKAGTGKTQLAVYIALEMYFNHEIEKIVITRPTVSKENIGYLPGGISEKLDPWVAPIYACMYSMMDKGAIDILINDRKIEIVPVSYMRGRTFLKSAIIVDESQNITAEQMIMILSRIGKESKMIVCGDAKQIDLPKKRDSGLYLFTSKLDIEGVETIELMQNHRHIIVDKLLEFYEKEVEGRK